jgi:hypothetical protein
MLRKKWHKILNWFVKKFLFVGNDVCCGGGKVLLCLLLTGILPVRDTWQMIQFLAASYIKR